MIRHVALLALTVSLVAAQDFSEIHIEKVEAGHTFTEGPVWSREGFLLFSDVPKDVIVKHAPGQKAEKFREKSNGANGNTFDAQGRLYTCESRTRRVVRTDKKGNLETLVERFEGKRLNAPNDIVVRHDGQIYFTDPAFGNQADARELDFYGVFHVTPKGQISVVAKPKGRPNGIALSPNGKILYIGNSDERNIRAYDLDGKGDPSNERVLIQDIDGVPDGMKVDEKGNLYVTARGVHVFNAHGVKLTTIELGETPANCAFGEPDFQTLFVTARTSVYRIRLDVKGSIQY
jgi:gluconolactonase